MCLRAELSAAQARGDMYKARLEELQAVEEGVAVELGQSAQLIADRLVYISQDLTKLRDRGASLARQYNAAGSREVRADCFDDGLGAYMLVAGKCVTTAQASAVAEW